VGELVVTVGYTIGEVLNQLKDDFEDITISKIRFLESEGLVFPDRTDAGYRKFSDDDVNRLRFILTAQRDHYLPLKVIREQLDRLDAGQVPAPSLPEDDSRSGAFGHPLRVAEIARALETAMSSGTERLLEQDVTGIALTGEELADATGLTAAEMRNLREYGLIGRSTSETNTFGAADLLVARASRELLRIGLEPRHLRMYLQFVDREVALFEQIVTPLLRQRNPDARQRAAEQLEQLAALTGRMKRALLGSALRASLHGRS
jgi:DNA-binding transcriptional MerR regulator